MLKAALHYLGIRLARSIYGGVGSILALHRVVPDAKRSRLTVNRALEITPEDLDAVLRLLKRKGFEFVAMDDILGRLRSRGGARFAAITLDDGYRDNVEHALPVFERHNVPFTVYATRAFSEHGDSLWWFTMEVVLLKAEVLEFSHRGREERFALGDDTSRKSAFEVLAARLRARGREERDELISAICGPCGIDPLRVTREFIMSSEELRELSKHPLATIGAHTVHHLTSNLLDETQLRAEFSDSKRWVEEVTGKPARHLAYPFGGRNAVGAREFRIARECGFETAVTTRFANVFRSHTSSAWALPRLEISGNYRAEVFAERAVSGLLPAIRNSGRRVVTD